jgi:leucyl-tRNA synthetase
MKIRYYCDNPDCSYDGQQPFILEFQHEGVMDEKNVATFFCPHCKSRLATHQREDAAA